MNSYLYVSYDKHFNTETDLKGMQNFWRRAVEMVELLNDLLITLSLSSLDGAYPLDPPQLMVPLNTIATKTNPRDSSKLFLFISFNGFFVKCDV